MIGSGSHLFQEEYCVFKIFFFLLPFLYNTILYQYTCLKNKIYVPIIYGRNIRLKFYINDIN